MRCLAKSFGPLLLFLAVCFPARATQITQLYSFGTNVVTSRSPSMTTTSYQQFDPSQGVLNSVKIVLDQFAGQDLTVENATAQDLRLLSLAGLARTDLYADSTDASGTPTIRTEVSQDYLSVNGGLTFRPGQSSGYGFGGGGGGGGGGGLSSSSSTTLTGSDMARFIGTGQTPFTLYMTSGWSVVGDSMLNITDYSRIGGLIALVYDYRVVGYLPEPSSIASLVIGVVCLGTYAGMRRTFRRA